MVLVDLDAEMDSNDGNLTSEHSTTSDQDITSTEKQDDNSETMGEHGVGTRAVCCLRFSVIAVLLLSTIAVALGMYYFIDTNENNNFESNFGDDAEKVFEALSTSLFLTLGAVDSYVMGLVSFANFTNQEWPFVTITDYAVRLAKVRSHSQAKIIQQSHFVTKEQRTKWENYTILNDGWVQDSLNVQLTDPTFDGKKFSNFTPDGVIHSYLGPSTGDGPFLPTWQSSPVIPVFSVYNWNALDYTSVSDAYEELVEGQRVVISKVSNLADPSNPVSVAESFAAVDYMKDFVGPDDDPSEPFSVINFPIVDHVARAVSLFDAGTGEAKFNTTVLGLVTVMFFWRDLLEDVVPNHDGVACVFENKCNQTFTYLVNGPDVEYLGPSDLHDPSFDRLVHSVNIAELQSYSPTAKAYTGIPLTGTVCGYTLSVYPSTAFKEEFTSNNPTLFAGVAVAIFAFCSIVFSIYDVCVERRQRRVMNSAVRSKANVTLLENMVQERTRKLQESNMQLEDLNERVVKASAAQLEHFAAMSHEIRTPLNCIIGLSSLLLETSMNPMQKESMRMIVNSGDLLLTVVNDILDYSKLESDNIEIVVKRSSLQESLSAVIQSIETKAKPKNLGVHNLFDPRVCEFVEMDTRRLQQILYNLLGNAIRFSYPGSQIELGVKILEEVVVNSGRSNSVGSNDIEQSMELTASSACIPFTLRFAVKNRGQGIEKADFERIFQPFRQANAETERVYGGTGLGLAICSKIATKMGGSIAVDSKEGEWAEFTVDLPVVGVPADLKFLSEKLRNVKLVLVDNHEESVTDMAAIFDAVHIDFAPFQSMDDFVISFSGKGEMTKRGKINLLLVREDLYNAKQMEVIVDKTNASLLTFGPKYSVPDSKWHIRSLNQQLPSVLLELLSKVASNHNVSSRSSFHESHRSCGVSTGVSYTDLSVLIAEDNKINQKVLHRLLTSALGLKNIEIVENGKLAVEREAEKQFDCIFMDYQMPVMDGIEATKLITRRDDVGHPVPIISFVTAHAAEEFEKECINAGADYFITKPFSKDELSKFFQLLPLIQAERLAKNEAAL